MKCNFFEKKKNRKEKMNKLSKTNKMNLCCIKCQNVIDKMH